MSTKHFFSWKEAWGTIDPTTLIGATVEICYIPPGSMVEVMMATEEEERETEERLTEYFRFSIEGVRPNQKPPFVMGRWFKYNKITKVWRQSEIYPQFLRVEKGASLLGIVVSDGKIISAGPAINLHVVFYLKEEDVPIEHLRSITISDLFELFEKAPRKN